MSRNRLAVGIALLFLATAGVVASTQIGGEPQCVLIIIAAVIGGYMALTIGANDVANNVGPAVGARALTMTGALVIAAVFEARRRPARRRRCGQDHLQRHCRPGAGSGRQVFVWVMMSALLASALWVHLATFLGAPVSTTHAIVGGVLGAGIAAVGFGVVDWVVVSSIFVSWLISPLIGGIDRGRLPRLHQGQSHLSRRQDRRGEALGPRARGAASQRSSRPISHQGLSHVWTPGFAALATPRARLCARVSGREAMGPRQSEGMENRNQALRELFHLPLICSAALLSFAHGSNDVANAVGPLAAILNSVEQGPWRAESECPFWVMLIGAAGISLGLFLFGPRIVRIVGEQITKMNPMRAFCVALSAALTVLVASQLGLPV